MILCILAGAALGGLFPDCQEAGCIQNVKELGSSDIARLEQAPTPSIVVFYSSWCPHCQQFAPEFQKAAAQFVDQQDAVAFGGYDCGVYGCSTYASHYPTLRIFGNSYPESGEVLDIKRSKAGVVNAVLALSKVKKPKDRNQDSKIGPKNKDEHESSVEWAVDELSASRSSHFWDAHVAVIVNMAEALFLHSHGEELTDTDWNSAKQYVSFAVNHFPDDFPKLKARLGDFAAFLRAEKPISEDKWRTDVMARFPKVMRGKTYKSCKGYTCAQWKLFHIVSLQVDEDDKVKFFEFLTNFATNFFGCSDCSEHFLAMLKSAKEEGYLMSPSFWVWNAHNTVTLRVHNGMRSRWPPVAICANCWAKDESAGDNVRENRWDIELFLQQHYGRTPPPGQTGSHVFLLIGFFVIVVVVARSSKKRRKCVNFLIRFFSKSSKLQSFPLAPVGKCEEDIIQHDSYAFHVFGDDVEKGTNYRKRRD